MTNQIEIRDACNLVLDEMERVIVGKRQTLESLLAAFMAGGHVLFEDMPGLGKTVTALSMAAALGLGFKRIQFTPDLLPGDITGGMLYSRKDESFSMRRGPLFSDFVLADEINRASPRTQSALLEAMQERHVTIDGQTLPLPRFFTVVATQNPVEYEGTFPLPEAQLDRFMVRLSLGYPGSANECEILRRRRERRSAYAEPHCVIDPATLDRMRLAMEDVTVSADMAAYIVALVEATRRHRNVAVGASPRGSLALQDLARATAAMAGRDYIIPDDVKQIAVATLAHRLVLEPGLWTDHAAPAKLVQSILDTVPVPAIAARLNQPNQPNPPNQPTQPTQPTQPNQPARHGWPS